MKHLIPSAIKRISINQCIVQAVRPRSIIAPIPFGIGVSLEKSIGSQSLSDLLSHVGFSITSDEIIRFKQSAAEINKARHQQESCNRGHLFHGLAIKSTTTRLRCLEKVVFMVCVSFMSATVPKIQHKIPVSRRDWRLNRFRARVVVQSTALPEVNKTVWYWSRWKSYRI